MQNIFDGFVAIPPKCEHHSEPIGATCQQTADSIETSSLSCFLPCGHPRAVHCRFHIVPRSPRAGHCDDKAHQVAPPDLLIVFSSPPGKICTPQASTLCELTKHGAMRPRQMIHARSASSAAWHCRQGLARLHGWSWPCGQVSVLPVSGPPGLGATACRWGLVRCGQLEKPMASFRHCKNLYH